jgi:GNAT superfamily N-acetyltransferase
MAASGDDTASPRRDRDGTHRSATMPSAATHHPFVSRLAALQDGTIVLLREQTPDDRGQIAELFAGLSSRSRYLRFGTGMPPALPRRYLDVLADVDGHRHAAILAIHDGRVIGAARYIRTGAAEAELAVTVTDAFQRRGLGRVLVETLTTLGATRGVAHFTFEILPANRAARALADRLSAGDRTLTTELPAHAAPELVATGPARRAA